FAVPSLEALLAAGHEAAAVFTQPDRPRGRGLATVPSPVKVCALKHGLPLCQPETFKGGGPAETLRALAPDAIAVVAYGRILPRAVLDIPPLGCVNVHGSLLPKYRGAAPIQRAVMNGERETGVTTMHIAPALDTGDMIYRDIIPIAPEDTSGTVHDKLMRIGAALLVKTLADLAAGTAPRVPQEDGLATFAPMLTREEAYIDWTQPAQAVHARIRGLSPWPVAQTGPQDSPIKIFAARLTDRVANNPPGHVLGVAPPGVEVVCGDGRTLLLTEVQGKGGRRMPADAYARGHVWPDRL
ncbi:MAG: methionyl-tRNA formyltransferase, partial [Oscillospiraceae bacterium]|nr:methionyl-tRNA formyltransferase [Oscillospiraceae bacterium]